MANTLQTQRIYNINRSAKQRGMPHTFTLLQWETALNYFHGCCAVCGRQLNDASGEIKAAADHWIPLIAYEDGPGSVASNIVPLCHGKGGCNNQKNYLLPDIWLMRKYSSHEATKIAARVEAYFDSLEGRAR